MKITICGSIDFTYKIKEIADVLSAKGHIVEIPLSAQKILNGEMSLEDFLSAKEKGGDLFFREKVKEDVIKRYYHIIGDSDAILVVNITKKGIENYIGGSVLMEIGFAYVLGKKIFLLNNIPDISYKDEIQFMKPVILNGDLEEIIKWRSRA